MRTLNVMNCLLVEFSHFALLACSRQQIRETAESKTTDVLLDGHGHDNNPGLGDDSMPGLNSSPEKMKSDELSEGHQ